MTDEEAHCEKMIVLKRIIERIAVDLAYASSTTPSSITSYPIIRESARMARQGVNIAYELYREACSQTRGTPVFRR